MKVLVCGDRKWSDWKKLNDRLMLLPIDTCFISGGAKGADLMAEQFARGHKMPITVYYADWNLHGLAAGPIRNRKMLSEKPDLVLAFHSNLMQSKGTKDCLKAAQALGIKTEVIS